MLIFTIWFHIAVFVRDILQNVPFSVSLSRFAHLSSLLLESVLDRCVYLSLCLLSICRSVLGRVDLRSDDSCMMLFCIFLNQSYSFCIIYMCMFPEYSLLGAEQIHKKHDYKVNL